jgi:hypothetical protein
MPQSIFPNPYSAFSSDLGITAELMTRAMLDSQSQRRVREAGGTADFNLALVNLYNEEYPDYGTPYVTLTTTSVNQANVRRTFTIVVSLFEHLVLARQTQAGAPPNHRISIHVVADTGPLVQAGSSKRTFAGLALLAVVAAFLLSSFLDRHQGRLSLLVSAGRARAADNTALNHRRRLATRQRRRGR